MYCQYACVFFIHIKCEYECCRRLPNNKCIALHGVSYFCILVIFHQQHQHHHVHISHQIGFCNSFFFIEKTEKDRPNRVVETDNRVESGWWVRISSASFVIFNCTSLARQTAILSMYDFIRRYTYLYTNARTCNGDTWVFISHCNGQNWVRCDTQEFINDTNRIEKQREKPKSKRNMNMIAIGIDELSMCVRQCTDACHIQ